MKNKIHILDCGFGNIQSVKNALDYLEVHNEILDNLNNVKNISHLILPGVGNFNKCIDILNKKKLILQKCPASQRQSQTNLSIVSSATRAS